MIYIRKKMEAAKTNVTQLAQRMGVSCPAVSNWASGKSTPDADKLPDLAQALGCSIDELFVDDEKEVS